MLRRFAVSILAAVAVLAAVGALMAAMILRHGVSARDEPTAPERVLAGIMRRMATPGSMRSVRNPVPATDDVLRDARAHFADHCAICHANDGSGRSEVGEHLYPRAPDMRLPHTQRLSDGELFSIISNGVRMTGMPAWGGSEGHDDDDTWKLVHLVRHFPAISDVEIEEMERLNPKSPDEYEELKKEEKFLRGGSPVAPPSPGHSSHHGDPN